MKEFQASLQIMCTGMISLRFNINASNKKKVKYINKLEYVHQRAAIMLRDLNFDIGLKHQIKKQDLKAQK